MSILPPPRLEHIADLTVEIAAPIEVGETGHGERRVIPISGGRVSGPRLNGRIRPAGADFQIVRPGGLAELGACYVIEADDGALIYVENTGIRHGPPELIARLRRGEPVDPGLIYFRTMPRFETAAPKYAFLMRHLFIGVGARHPDSVMLGLWMVL
jgi:Protein of unknown function (DUF3237)